MNKSKKPFLALPPGLGGAMAITVKNLGVEETNGGCCLLRNWREMLGFEDKVVGEWQREDESLALSMVLGENEELRWWKVDKEDAIDEANWKRAKFSENEQ